MIFLMPIPPKPPWYSTPTAIVPLPTTAPNCNSPIESPTDTPATENCKHKSYDNIENNNDCPDDDDDDDVDCFHRQDKQPVLPQDILPTAPIANNNPPSLIDSPMDTSTHTITYTYNNKNDDNDDDGDSTVIHHNQYYDNDDDDDDDTFFPTHSEYGEYDYNDDFDDDDDDDDSYASFSSKEDSYNYNPNLIIDMYVWQRV